MRVLMTDPITSIEDKKAYEDMGRMGYFLVKGALSEGATWKEAVAVAAAYFQGIFKSVQGDPDAD